LVANDNFSSSVYVSPQNWQGETKSIVNFAESWSLLWKQKNEKFEAFLKADANLSSLSRKLLYVWDGNHRLQAWLPCINSIHPNDVDWHVSIHSFVLDTTCKLVELLIAMTNLNKYVKIKPKLDA
jgi:hypothetical protein